MIWNQCDQWSVWLIKPINMRIEPATIKCKSNQHQVGVHHQNNHQTQNSNPKCLTNPESHLALSKKTSGRPKFMAIKTIGDFTSSDGMGYQFWENRKMVRIIFQIPHVRMLNMMQPLRLGIYHGHFTWFIHHEIWGYHWDVNGIQVTQFAAPFLVPWSSAITGPCSMQMPVKGLWEWPDRASNTVDGWTFDYQRVYCIIL